ncbi:MAG: hypothetical protein L0H63_00755 [Nitrococcus sp.]|nr:hypothetical protein [Nitrococcus sp.]
MLTTGAPSEVIRTQYVNQAYAGRFDVRPDLLTGRPLVLASPPAAEDR